MSLFELPGRSAPSTVDGDTFMREDPTGPARTWAIRVYAPAPWLTANIERHHYKRSKLVRQWREATRDACLTARLPTGITGPVTVHASVRYQGNRAPVRDRLNLAPTIKALVDALTPSRTFTRAGKTYVTAGFGLLRDDSDRHIAQTTWVMGPSGIAGAAWVDLVITEVRA